MKKLSIALLFFGLVFTGCDRQPEACFEVSSSVVEPFDAVSFTNCSSNADFYQWDMGNGTGIDAENPTTTFVETGIFTVKMDAFSKNGYKEDSQETIIEVRNRYIDKLVLKSLNFSNINGAPWDPNSGPDVKVYFGPTSLQEYQYETSVFEDITADMLPLTWEFSDSLLLLERNKSWKFLMVEVDGSTEFDLMVGSINSTAVSNPESINSGAHILDFYWELLLR